MRPFKLVLFILMIAAASPTSIADDDRAARFSDFGSWVSPCDAWGIDATCSSTWRRGLGASHVVQDYAIVDQADQSVLFSGRGLYRIEGDQVDGVWEDSRGALLQLSGTYEDRALDIIWVDPHTEIGRSVYVWSDDVLRAEDSVLTDDGWRAFMTIDYPRP